MKTIVNPSTLPRPIGFSHGITTTGGKLVFLAGQTGSDSNGDITAPGDLVAQFEQTLRNLQAVVGEAGGTLRDVVKMNLFVRSRDDYVTKRKALGEVYRKYFGAWYPTMALFEISALFQEEALIEIEGIAVIGG
jgi:enamine deaminase RidA (YjgF/YER057c/UK114 family)